MNSLNFGNLLEYFKLDSKELKQIINYTKHNDKNRLILSENKVVSSNCQLYRGFCNMLTIVNHFYFSIGETRLSDQLKKNFTALTDNDALMRILLIANMYQKNIKKGKDAKSVNVIKNGIFIMAINCCMQSLFDARFESEKIEVLSNNKFIKTLEINELLISLQINNRRGDYAIINCCLWQTYDGKIKTHEGSFLYMNKNVYDLVDNTVVNLIDVNAVLVWFRHAVYPYPFDSRIEEEITFELHWFIPTPITQHKQNFFPRFMKLSNTIISNCDEMIRIIRDKDIIDLTNEE